MDPDIFPEAADFVARLRAGDNTALGPLYERYASRVYRVGLLFLGDDMDAEDLVQDVFAGLSRKLETYDERGAFWSWLRLVTVRTALMKLRATKRERAFLRFRRWQSRASQPPAVVEARVDLGRAIAMLPDRLRTVFVLKDVEGMTHGEIAGLLGISVSAAKVRLFRAREVLRRKLTP